MEPDAIGSSVNGEPKRLECALDHFELPTEAVLQTVASIRDVRIDQLDTLYDTIDPDALNTVISNGSDHNVFLQFEYEHCIVNVSNQRVQVTEIP